MLFKASKTMQISNPKEESENKFSSTSSLNGRLGGGLAHRLGEALAGDGVLGGEDAVKDRRPPCGSNQAHEHRKHQEA